MLSTTEVIISQLQNKAFLLVENTFCDASMLAFKLNLKRDPVLFEVPQFFSKLWKPLLSVVGVKEEFEAKDYVKGLQYMHMNNVTGESKLTDRDLEMVINMLNSLCSSIREQEISVAALIKSCGEIYVPSTDRVLTATHAVCYRSMPVWGTKSNYQTYTYYKVNQTMAATLGISTDRMYLLRNHMQEIHSWDKDTLTDNMSQCVEGYPDPCDILKQIIKKVDELGAQNIHLILDERKHSTEQVFEENWKPLQGKSLCIYFDKPMNQQDEQNFYDKGGFNTTNSTYRTQFGIGFNACHCFGDAILCLVSDPQIGDRLSIFDPQGKYIPDASGSKTAVTFHDISKLKHMFGDVYSGHLKLMVVHSMNQP